MLCWLSASPNSRHKKPDNGDEKGFRQKNNGALNLFDISNPFGNKIIAKLRFGLIQSL